MQHHYLEVIDRGIDFLKILPPQMYTVIPDEGDSSIGSHIRHIVDHFSVVKVAMETSCVDYENRSRGCSLEVKPSVAIEKLCDLKAWEQYLSRDALAKQVTVHTDIGVAAPNIAKVTSTLGRELIFCCSHAIHHYALVKVIYEKLGGQMSDSFGLAPSTANFLRQHMSPN